MGLVIKKLLLSVLFNFLPTSIFPDNMKNRVRIRLSVTISGDM